MIKILQYSGVFGAILIISGALKFYFYYKQFNISVLRFFDLQEILTLFMDNVLAFLGAMLVSTFFILHFHENIKADISNEKIKAGSILIEQWGLILKYIVVVTTFVFVYKFVAINVTYKDALLLTLLGVIMFTIVPLLYILVVRKFGGIVETESLKTTDTLFYDGYIFIYSLIFICYSIATGFNEAYKVKNKRYYKGVSIEFKDSTAISGDGDTCFLGVSKNYIYLYDFKTNTGIVHSIDNVKAIAFPKPNSHEKVKE
ncbi:hypothetical protein IQ13_0137 [Lacibacter cauensis]|uniref:Uncharacterized protein n=1 Tax=Lacibacter cauensis TaxID=510947 RepID=A0A562SVB9_9BACT|nr:hypothetical protein [Lacibacter cauensis]TWI84984.1 hypothetical protein IQ13_0137 [Lacibacter cauensis]